MFYSKGCIILDNIKDIIRIIAPILIRWFIGYFYKMKDGFSLDEYLIKIMPGGCLLYVLWLFFWDIIHIELDWNYDVLSSFIFLCISYIVWEVLQTIAHYFEFIINFRFKFRKPSEIFLYKNNPVIKKENKRKELISLLNLGKEENKIFESEYSQLPYLKFWKINKENNALSQSYFRTIYCWVKNNPEIKCSNRNYLFVRAILLVFIILTILLIYHGYNTFSRISFALTIILFFRARGMARQLIFNSVLSYLMKYEWK